MATFDHRTLEARWQSIWETQHTYETTQDPSIPRDKRAFVLDMFPYPSGAGLHVGHPKGYTATDVISRYRHAKGYNVLHTIGFDAFGLPAENYAIKTGTHPRISTNANIETFTKQLKSIGFSYDWSREIDTTNPEYYRWTQWIFIELFKRGLAYEQDLPINYCPHDKTGLANEEVIHGCCERCGTKVERRAIRQWVLKITEYADRLISDLDGLDWPEGIKEMQRGWIGKSEGCEFRLAKSDNESVSLAVYTTRIDTVYGMSYVVIAPDHRDVEHYITSEHRGACESYIHSVASKSDQDRTNESSEKTGVFTGSYVINPYNGEKVPVWIADYVLGHYGTGAVMAVPAHDERDFAFAKKYSLPILQSIALAKEFDPDVWQSFYGDDGLVIALEQMPSDVARPKLIAQAESEGFGQKKINYKLRDWLFSRQRYWGEPIPLMHMSHDDYTRLPRVSSDSAWIESRGDEEYLMCGDREISRIYRGISSYLLIDSNLPVELPELDRFEPAEDGQSPLARASDWLEVQIAPNLTLTRETNTMPQWGGSCWYYLAYMSTGAQGGLADREAIDYWSGQVTEYVGGAEHAVLHLLYARFWHKVLFDIGVVPTKEPFQKLTNVGLILGPDGEKMSKSKGNVINPNDIVSEYGADTLRLYLMGMSDFRDAAPWNTDAIIGMRRFVDKAYTTVLDRKRYAQDDMKSMKLLHKTIKKVSEDIEAYKFNTAISALMILLNE